MVEVHGGHLRRRATGSELQAVVAFAVARIVRREQVPQPMQTKRRGFRALVGLFGHRIDLVPDLDVAGRHVPERRAVVMTENVLG
ncbi:hypothetical protein [Azospirillum tabaci]|uniref:hypothetical protein n=1 Tax=Azospirillum tabaci TaxID=2752310 RepID=UPI0016617371|nr:hypothetical protein [Azospirillum tabaci]